MQKYLMQSIESQFRLYVHVHAQRVVTHVWTGSPGDDRLRVQRIADGYAVLAMVLLGAGIP
jgi:hypothetical protein